MSTNVGTVGIEEEDGGSDKEERKNDSLYKRPIIEIKSSGIFITDETSKPKLQ
jgi:hypothetical protein